MTIRRPARYSGRRLFDETEQDLEALTIEGIANEVVQTEAVPRDGLSQTVTDLLTSTNDDEFVAALPPAVVVVDPNTGKIPVGDLPAVGGGDTWTAPGIQPAYINANDEVTFSHPAIVNEQYDILIKRNTGQTGATNISLDFDALDASLFTQQDNSKTAFVGGVVQLSGGTGSGFPTANLALSLDNALTDSSAVPATMTSSGITYSSDVPSGYSGKSLNVDTTAGLYVKAAPRTRSDIGGSAWTIAFWHKFASNGATIRNILDSRDANGASPWVLYDKADTALTIWDGSAETVVANAGFFSSGWHHYALVRNGANTYAYKDGVLQKTTSVSGGTWPPNGDSITGTTLFTNVDHVQPFTGQTRDFIIAPSALWSSNFTPPTYSGIVYPTTDYWWVATTDLSQFTWTNVSYLNSVTISGTQPANTNRKWLVSFDGRVTWNKWDGAAWNVWAGGLGDIANGNTTAELQTGLTNRTPGVGEVGLDFAVALQTTVATSTPTVDLITINYDEPARYDPATVGAYGASTEFGFQRINSTSSKIKNQTVSTQKILYHIITPSA